MNPDWDGRMKAQARAPKRTGAVAARRLSFDTGGVRRLAAAWRDRARAYRDRARAYRDQADLLLPNRAGDAERDSLLWRARAYETAAEELTLALNQGVGA